MGILHHDVIVRVLTRTEKTSCIRAYPRLNLPLGGMKQSISSIIRTMTIKIQLNESMKDAMKSGDEVRKRTVRMALASIKQAEVDKRIELDDPAVMNILQKEIKNRRE